jgi:hypothetical protein
MDLSKVQVSYLRLDLTEFFKNLLKSVLECDLKFKYGLKCLVSYLRVDLTEF